MSIHTSSLEESRANPLEDELGVAVRGFIVFLIAFLVVSSVADLLGTLGSPLGPSLLHAPTHVSIPSFVVGLGLSVAGMGRLWGRETQDGATTLVLAGALLMYSLSVRSVGTLALASLIFSLPIVVMLGRSGAHARLSRSFGITAFVWILGQATTKGLDSPEDILAWALLHMGLVAALLLSRPTRRAEAFIAVSTLAAPLFVAIRGFTTTMAGPSIGVVLLFAGFSVVGRLRGNGGAMWGAILGLLILAMPLIGFLGDLLSFGILIAGASICFFISLTEK